MTAQLNPSGRALSLALMLYFAPFATAESIPNNPGRIYGKTVPFTIQDLPAGRLRADLENLPPQAQKNALQRLHEITFPAADTAFLRVDPEGGVFYEDPLPPAAPPQSTKFKNQGITGNGGTIEETVSPVISDKAFKLHSKPGASRVVYVNMAGATVTGTIWNRNSGFSTLYMLPYSSDSDYTTFTQIELDSIAETWKRIAEDFAPFDVDVTTEKPASFGPSVGHILVTRKADQYGNSIYNCSCGGVAYLNVWGASNYPYYQPALVFTDGVGTGPHNISEAASHEMGHNLSLSHDGTSSSGYYSGQGSGNVDWAPIMGVGYYGQVTQWSKGEYSDAKNTQDDLALISSRLNYRPDDHENINYANATPLKVTDFINVYSTTPVLDPDNVNPDNKGMIENRNDVDLFFVDAGTGTVDLTVTPVWLDVFTTQSYRGANPDIRATLYDATGNVVAQHDPVTDTYARINTSVAAGAYFLAIEGVGVGDPLVAGYSDYASIGQYFINGTVPASIPDTVYPTSPAMVSIVAASSTSIAMTSTIATDDRGSVQYQFHCVSGGTGCADSGWQASTSYTATGLAPGTSYAFQVRARDLAGNTTGYSASATVSTLASPVVHIGDLDNASTKTSKNWTAVVPILVHDAAHSPVSGAVVNGTWSTGTTGTGSCTTSGTGQCSISKANLKTTLSSVKFTVTGISKSGNTYAATSNHDPDSSGKDASTGTVITVVKP